MTMFLYPVEIMKSTRKQLKGRINLLLNKRNFVGHSNLTE